MLIKVAGEFILEMLAFLPFVFRLEKSVETTARIGRAG